MYRCYINWKNILSKHNGLQMFSQRQHQAICSTVSLFNCWQDMKVGFMNTEYFLICGEFEHYTYVIPLPTFISLGLLWKLLWLGAISFATIFLHFHKKNSKNKYSICVQYGKVFQMAWSDSTFRIQQPLDSELVFGYSKGMVQSLHRAQSDHLIPAESIWPKTRIEWWQWKWQHGDSNIQRFPVLRWLRSFKFLHKSSEINAFIEALALLKWRWI